MAPGDKPDLIHLLLAQLQEQMVDLVSKMGEVQGDVQSIKGTVDRIAPLVDTHESQRNQARGAMHLGKGMWQLLASGGIGAALVEAGQYFLGNGHPPHHP